MNRSRQTAPRVCTLLVAVVTEICYRRFVMQLMLTGYFHCLLFARLLLPSVKTLECASEGGNGGRLGELPVVWLALWAGCVTAIAPFGQVLLSV